MPSFPDPDNNRNDKIDFIIAHRFGSGIKSIKRFGPLMHPQRGQKLPDISDALEAEKKLGAMADDELEAEYRGVREAIARASEAKAKFEAEQRARNEAMLPINYAGDFAYWAKCPYWSIEEAVALLHGRDPRTANSKSINPYLQVSPFARLFDQTLNLAMRAVGAKLLTNGTRPGDFLVWAKRYDFEVPPALEQAVARYGHALVDWKARYDEVSAELTAERARRSLEEALAKVPPTDTPPSAAVAVTAKGADPRELDSLRKLCIAMAVRGYGYDPTALRNESIADIVGDLDLLGLRLDRDTVRRHLKTGADLLEPGTLEEAFRKRRVAE